MARPKKEEQIGNLAEVIKETAWETIAERGAAALSLRAIARRVGISAPAIYNYFPSRDDLVTALIGDAFSSFGDSQLKARDAAPPDDLIAQLLAIGLAYREWALTYPQRYQLIFGSPIPGYQPPASLRPVGARSMSALVSVLEALRQAGRLRTDSIPTITPEFQENFIRWTANRPAAYDKASGDTEIFSSETQLQTFSVAILVWSQVHGLVSLEVGGHIPTFGPPADSLYRYELALLSLQFIIEN